MTMTEATKEAINDTVKKTIKVVWQSLTLDGKFSSQELYIETSGDNNNIFTKLLKKGN